MVAELEAQAELLVVLGLTVLMAVPQIDIYLQAKVDLEA